MRFTFVRREHEEFGTPGWLLVGAPASYQPYSGQAVAHDVLEHRRNDSGGVEDELQALGTMLLIRGTTGYFMYSAADALAADTRILATEYRGLYTIEDPGKTKPLSPMVEGWIASACQQVANHVAQEVGNDVEEEDLSLVPGYLECMTGWLRRGYRRGVRRYRGLDLQMVKQVFNTIERGANNAMRNNASKLVVHIKFKTGWVDVEDMELE